MHLQSDENCEKKELCKLEILKIEKAKPEITMSDVF